MTLTKTILQNGLRQGIRSLWRLSRFVLPTVFLLTLLQHSPFFPWIADLLSPLTAPLGLPGDAALLLLTGLFINKFAGIAGLLLLPLSPMQFFTAALFLALAHNLIIEQLIVYKSGLPVVRLALLRAGIAYVAACLAHLLLTLTGWLSDVPLTPVLKGVGTTAEPLWQTAVMQALHSVWMLALFLLPLFLLMEALRQLHLMHRLEQFATPLTTALRLPATLTPALLSGLLLGVATGAGVIEQTLSERTYSQQELRRLNVFLLLFHSVIEDTLMFLLFPVPILAIALARLTVAWVACRLMP